MSKPKSVFWLEVFGNDFQNCIHLTIAKSSWRTFSLKKRFFSQPSSVLKRNFSRFSVKILQRSWQKSVLFVQWNNWWKTNFLKEKILLRIYGYSAIWFWDLTRSFNWVAKTSHYMPNQLFDEKHFFWTEVYIQYFFGIASEKFRPDFLNIFRLFQRKFFTEKTFLFKKSCLFPVIGEVSSGYLVETFWQDVQNCISIVQRSMIPGKNCFFEKVDFFSNLDLEQMLFESFAATFRQLTEKCNPSVHRNNLKK